LSKYRAAANFPEPWPGGWWRLRDIVDYELVAAESLLELAARYRVFFLENFARLARRQVELGRTTPPFAYIVPRRQDDFPTAIELLRVLARGGVEIARSEEEFSAAGARYPAGTLVIPMDQPYRAHAKDLLEIQRYPDRRLYPGGPPEQPYDITGWTLGLMMGVRVVAVTDGPLGAGMVRLKNVAMPPGSVSGRGPCYAFDTRLNNSYRAANLFLEEGLPVYRLKRPLTRRGWKWPPGSFVVNIREERLGLLRAAADTLGVDFLGFGSRPDPGSSVELRLPRPGLYKPWTRNRDEGWTRWVLEQFAFPYRVLTDARIRAGSLFPEYRAIIMPDMSEDEMARGNRPGSLPAKFTGGLGREGVRALDRFARDGGTLICLDSSGGAVTRLLGLPVTDLMTASLEGEEKRKRDRFHCPGSILSLEIDPNDPLAWGMPDRVPVYFASSPVFRLKAVDDSAAVPVVVGRYPGINPLLSGWITGDEFVRGRPALVECPHGRGRVVLIGFRAQHRAQTHGTFKLLFNAIYSGESR